MKKAQVTIFIIIIIVISILILGLYFLSNYFRERNLKENAGETQKIPSDFEPVISYMKTCAETVAKEGMFLLGIQGGYIYKSQGGKTIDFPDNTKGTLFIDYQSYRIPYKIQLPVAGLECDPILPGYPTKYLYYPYGKEPKFNDPNAVVKENYLSDKQYEKKDCFGKRIKIEIDDSLKDLQSYVTKKIKTDCDLSVFPNYNFDSSEPEIKVESRSTTTDFTVLYPKTATDKNKGTIINLEPIKINLKLSLAELFDFTNTITQYDVTDPTYNISRSDESQEFKILILSDIYEKDDLITITSELLTLDGKNFKFNFARRNRFPILEYIYGASFNEIPFILGTEITWDKVIHQELVALDPDEDSLIIIVTAGEGIYAQNFTSDNFYTIRQGDIYNKYVLFRISASDGEYNDYQDFKIA